MKLKILRKINSIYLIITLILILNIFVIPTTYSIYSDKDVVDNNSISTARFSFTSNIYPANSLQRSTTSLVSNIETREFLLNLKNTGELRVKFEVRSIPNPCDNLWVIVKDSNGITIFDGFVKDLKYSIDKLGVNKEIEYTFKIMTNSGNIKCEIPIQIQGWQEIFDSNDYGYRLKTTEIFQFEIVTQVVDIDTQLKQIEKLNIINNIENNGSKRELMDNSEILIN